MADADKFGIDFGTTNSGAGVFDGRQLRILPLDPQSSDPGVVRTLLYLTRDGQAHVGQAAINTYYEQNIGRARRLAKEVVGEILVVAAEIPAHVRDVPNPVVLLATVLREYEPELTPVLVPNCNGTYH